MKNETRLILTVFRNFMDRPEIKDREITAQMPVDARLGDISGKEVEIPMTSVFQGMTNKLSFTEMAKVLDENNEVVSIFLEEMCVELDGYAPAVDEPGISIKDKGEAVDKVANELEGEFNEDK
jgi:transcription antitermination factor NusA-like protein